ncbi:MAG: hypothetical protein JW776_15810 [Candidatus Lokiarchaeota archaeon]|nr:hypothetical protein [Candidatus Lokiarchaeota archaeon]
MDNIGLILVLSLVIGVFIGIINLMLLKVKQRFRNKALAQLKESKLFTLIRIFGYAPFLVFATILGINITLYILLVLYSWIPANMGIRVLLILMELVIIAVCGFISTKIWKYVSILPKPFREPVNPPKLSIKNGDNIEEYSALVSTFDKIYELLDINLIHPFGKINNVFSIPGGPYGHPYLWDSAFISGIWRVWDPKIAREILRVFLDLQSEEGQCPQNITYGKRPYYVITNPPLLAWALLKAAEMDDEFQVLEELYPKLTRFHRFLYEYRRKNGLFVWKHSYESGIDNSPRFTDRSEKLKYNIDHLWAVDFNTWMVLQNDCLAKIAEKLGYIEDSKYFVDQREKLKHLINKYLWDEKTGLYYDYDYLKKELSKIPTIASIFPMFAEIPDEEQARKLIAHIKDEYTFNTVIPFPSVARNYPDFMKDCWRGAVWINTAYVGVKSLEKYGENKLAGELAFKLVNGIAQTYRNEGSIYEFYDSDAYRINELTRKKGNLYKQITIGGKPVKNFVGWTGLSNTMLIEDVLGIHFQKNEITLEPHLPELLLGTKITIELPYFDKIVYMNSDPNQKITAEVTSFSDMKSVKGSVIYEGSNHGLLNKKVD